MKMYLLKVYPVGMGREVYRKIEILGGATLDDLCRTIINSFDFIHEHMYEFCMDNRMYSDYSYQSAPKRGEASTRIKLDRLQLQEKQKFLLHYDFGDDWQFVIRVEKIIQVAEEIKPRVTKEKGEIVQYPDFEDEDFEDEDFEDE